MLTHHLVNSMPPQRRKKVRKRYALGRELRKGMAQVKEGAAAETASTDAHTASLQQQVCRLNWQQQGGQARDPP